MFHLGSEQVRHDDQACQCRRSDERLTLLEPEPAAEPQDGGHDDGTRPRQCQHHCVRKWILTVSSPSIGSSPRNWGSNFHWFSALSPAIVNSRRLAGSRTTTLI